MMNKDHLENINLNNAAAGAIAALELVLDGTYKKEEKAFLRLEYSYTELDRPSSTTQLMHQLYTLSRYYQNNSDLLVDYIEASFTANPYLSTGQSIEADKSFILSWYMESARQGQLESRFELIPKLRMWIKDVSSNFANLILESPAFQPDSSRRATILLLASHLAAIEILPSVNNLVLNVPDSQASRIFSIACSCVIDFRVAVFCDVAFKMLGSLEKEITLKTLYSEFNNFLTKKIKPEKVSARSQLHYFRMGIKSLAQAQIEIPHAFECLSSITQILSLKEDLLRFDMHDKQPRFENQSQINSVLPIGEVNIVYSNPITENDYLYFASYGSIHCTLVGHSSINSYPHSFTSFAIDGSVDTLTFNSLNHSYLRDDGELFTKLPLPLASALIPPEIANPVQQTNQFFRFLLNELWQDSPSLFAELGTVSPLIYIFEGSELILGCPTRASQKIEEVMPHAESIFGYDANLTRLGIEVDQPWTFFKIGELFVQEDIGVKNELVTHADCKKLIRGKIGGHGLPGYAWLVNSLKHFGVTEDTGGKGSHGSLLRQNNERSFRQTTSNQIRTTKNPIPFGYLWQTLQSLGIRLDEYLRSL